MTTRRLYYEDTTLHETDAVVLSMTRTESGVAVIPDRTVIFPGGGGQPGDRGWIGDREVRLCVSEGDTVVHHLDSFPLGMAVGSAVRLRVDETWRRETAQQHTGQHIVSAALLETAGIATVSVHMGQDTLTVECPVPGIEEETLLSVQTRANAVVCSNRPVVTHLVTDRELERFRLRRPAAPRDRHRVVEIVGYDAAACGGVHVRTTADVRLVLWTGMEKIRGNTRTHWLVGDRAWRRVEQSGGLLRSLGQELSAAPEDILAAVQGLRERQQGLEERAAAMELAAAQAHAERILAGSPDGGGRVRVETFQALDRGVFRALTQLLSRQTEAVVLLANREGDTALFAACCGPGPKLDLTATLGPHLARAAVKGGGRGGVWQGVARDPSGLDTFLGESRQSLERALSTLS